jgi:hypothetical protein
VHLCLLLELGGFNPLFPAILNLGFHDIKSLITRGLYNS